MQILAFNDFHGALEPPVGKRAAIPTADGPVPAGGVEYLMTWIERLTLDPERTIVVTAGDNIGASPLLSAAFQDEPTIEALSLLGLQISSVGNHEFDEGIDELRRIQAGGCHPEKGCFGGDGFEGARFRYLAANVRTEDGGTLMPPYVIRSLADPRNPASSVDVAFIGMTLKGTPELVTPAGTRGVSFDDEAETVARLVPELHAKGIHAIVVLLHEGGLSNEGHNGCGLEGPIVDIAKRLHPDVDVVIAGHTDAAHVCDIDGKLVTSAAHWGCLVTDIRLTLDPVTRDVRTKSAKNVIVRRDVPEAPRMTALLERYKALVEGVEARVVGTITADIPRTISRSGEMPLGLLIADAHLFAERDPSTGGAELALTNPGGVRADLLFASSASGEAPGEVTFGEIFAVQPFGNDLVTQTFSGAQLERLLEQQFAVDGVERERPKLLQPSAGLRYRWDPRRAPGDRIDRATIEVLGAPLDPARDYRIVSNSFLAEGGDAFSVMREGRDRKIGVADVDALAFYLGQHPGLKPPPPGRIRTIKP